MRVLLDTQALFWALVDEQRLSPRARDVVGDATCRKLVSAASGYELSFKHRLGKLPAAAALAADFEGVMAALDVELLPISPAHAVAAGRLDPVHRDPFDRLLAGQALIERTPIVSVDTAFDRFGVARIW